MKWSRYRDLIFHILHNALVLNKRICFISLNITTSGHLTRIAILSGMISWLRRYMVHDGSYTVCSQWMAPFLNASWRVSPLLLFCLTESSPPFNVTLRFCEKLSTPLYLYFIGLQLTTMRDNTDIIMRISKL